MLVNGQEAWGMELLLDLKGCDADRMSKGYVERFVTELGRRIDMKLIGETVIANVKVDHPEG